MFHCLKTLLTNRKNICTIVLWILFDQLFDQHLEPALEFLMYSRSQVPSGVHGVYALKTFCSREVKRREMIKYCGRDTIGGLGRVSTTKPHFVWFSISF